MERRVKKLSARIAALHLVVGDGRKISQLLQQVKEYAAISFYSPFKSYGNRSLASLLAANSSTRIGRLLLYSDHRKELRVLLIQRHPQLSIYRFGKSTWCTHFHFLL